MNTGGGKTGRLPRGRIACVFAVLAVLLLWMPLALAQSGPANCTITSTPVAFGVYDPVLPGAAVDGVGQFVVDCTPGKVTFVARMGTGQSNSYAARRMYSGTDPLEYNLYLDANRTRVFGDGTGGSQTIVCTTGVDTPGCDGTNPQGGGRRAIVPFYGRIPPEQDAAAGLYTDTVTLEIAF